MPRTRERAESAPETDAPETDAPETITPDAPETDAPETITPDAPETDAPETDPVSSLAEEAARETLVKAAGVFDTVAVNDAPAYISDPDDPARAFALQRERRADGSHGPLMLAVITRRAVKGAAPVENAQRIPLAEVESARRVLLGAGIRLFRAE